MNRINPEPASTDRLRGLSGTSAKTISSAELFGNLREIVILHAGEEYRLRITSNGKLILTK